MRYLYVIAKKETHAVLDAWVEDVPDIEMSALISQHIQSLFLTESQVSSAVFPKISDIEAFLAPHSYEIIWSEGGEICDIKFDLLDHLNWLRCTIEERVFAGDPTAVKISSLYPDKSDVDISDNSEIDAIISTPDGNIPVCLQLRDGEASFVYPMKPGFYQLPINKFDNYRVEEIKEVRCVIKLTA